MRVIVSIKPAPGGGAASQAARYVAYRERDDEREGSEPRKLFSAQENTLSFWAAERVLTAGRAPAKDEVAHLVVSLKPDDFQALGRDETTRQESLKTVTREAITEIAQELGAEQLRWVAGIHRNTEHPHLHLLIHKDYVVRATDQARRFHRLPESALAHRIRDETGAEKILPGSFSQAFITALEQAQEHTRISLLQQRETNKTLYARPASEGLTNMAEKFDTLTERLLAAAQRNPSLAGRALSTEIILRSASAETSERASPRDLRSAFRTATIDEAEYRSPQEQADWLGQHSQTLRDFYERGASLQGDVFYLPAEEHELPAAHEQPFITSLSYAVARLGNTEQATEFHALAKSIAGQTADVRTEVEVFRHYYAQLKSADQSDSRTAATEQTLSAMRPLAAAMQALETRDSVEIMEQIEPLAEHTQNDHAQTDRNAAFHPAARTINLRDEALQLPAELSQAAQEKIMAQSLPTLDRLLESGKDKRALVAAIEGAIYQPDLSEAERRERFQISEFLKDYLAERWRDPETRALNASPAFRAAQQQLHATTTPQELNRFAEQFLRDNVARGAALRLHKTDPVQYPSPELLLLNARERNLLFFGRTPAHHTPEMQELRYAWGLTREARTARVRDLQEGRAQPSSPLAKMLQELDTRQSLPALKHYQASLLNDKMDNPGKVALRPLYEQLPPHERTFLLERIETNKQPYLRPEIQPREAGKEVNQPTSSAPRAAGELPRTSQAYREYMARMGFIEQRLLNEAVQQRQAATRGILVSKEEYSLSITQARTLLPAELQISLRRQARQNAWQQLALPEKYAATPGGQQVSDTIIHLQENSQQRARLAQQVLEAFVQEKIGASVSQEKITNVALTTLTQPDAQRWQALQDYAVRTREELYRGFESLDTMRHEIVQTRTVKETVLEKSDYQPEIKTEPITKTTETSLHNEHLDAPDRNLTLATATESERSAWRIESDQQWHFDHLPAPQELPQKSVSITPAREEVEREFHFER